MKKRNILLILILLSVTSCSYCEFMKEQRLRKIQGVVIDKKIYKWDRGRRFILIKDFLNYKLKYTLPNDYEYDDFWNSISVGDSIYKDDNSDNVLIFKGGKLFDNVKVESGCNNQ